MYGKRWEKSLPTYRVFLHLDIKHSPILECPFHHVCLMGDTFDMLTIGKVGPPLVKVLELDQMPDMG